jgi:hypothetical protein
MRFVQLGNRGLVCDTSAWRMRLTKRSVGRLIFCIATLLYASAGSFARSQRPQRPPSRWTGTWAVAPQRGTLDAPAGAGPGNFAQKTLRQTFRVSVGGSKVRIRLSNIFGQGPLTIGNVHIARAASDRAIFIRSDKTVTFHGQGSVSIPAGETVVSDPVNFMVEALSDVTVSMYIPKAIEGDYVTKHTKANQNIFIADGDVSGAASVDAIATLQSYYFLTDADVLAVRPGRLWLSARRSPTAATRHLVQICVGQIYWPNV